MGLNLSNAIVIMNRPKKPSEKKEVNTMGWICFLYCLNMTAKHPLQMAEKTAVMYPGLNAILLMLLGSL